MIEDAIAHLLYGVNNAAARPWPFPHFEISETFPKAFFQDMVTSMPKPDDYEEISAVRGVSTVDGTKAYKDRHVIRLHEEGLKRVKDEGRRKKWTEIAGIFADVEFAQALFQKFRPILHARFEGDAPVAADTLLIRDRGGYKLGPHSDHPRRVVVFILYLSDGPHGTSFYVPKDRVFTDPGGPHYPREMFDMVHTVPHRPNHSVCFVKTDNSFHGVEPVTEGERHLIHFFLKDMTPEKTTVAAPEVKG